MPELRKDPITDRWVIIAKNRANRPFEFPPEQSSSSAANCPFCAGHEDQTPPALAVYPPAADDRAGDWQVRVVSNRYPAVSREEIAREPRSGSFFGKHAAALDETQPPKNVPDPFGSGRSEGPCAESSDDLFCRRSGIGAHEVIIQSPQHVRSITELTDDQLCWSFRSYRDRLREHSGDAHLRYGSVFQNVGAAAGASLEHLHAQLVVLPIVPPDVQRQLDGAEQYFRNHEKCIYCEIVRRELVSEVRLVARTNNFVAFCPYASRFSYETWIVPVNHASRFEQSVDADLDEAARLSRDVVAGLATVLDRPSYNLLFQTAPFDMACRERYHWKVEIFPRTAKIAGFELASGLFINSVPPEQAAQALRAAVASGRNTNSEHILNRKDS